MLDDRHPSTGTWLATVDRAGSTGHAARLGAERRQRPDSRRDDASDWRFELLNELDYGIVVLDWDSRLLYVNQAARSRLLDTQALRLERGELVATQPRDASPARPRRARRWPAGWRHAVGWPPVRRAPGAAPACPTAGCGPPG